MNQHEFLKIIIKENINRQLLYEGLIFSYSPSFTIRKIKESGFKDVQYNPNENVILINFALDKNNKERYAKLNGLLNKPCGWYHGVSIADGIPTLDKLHFLNIERGNVLLKYEAKFDMEIDEIPDKIYHLTTCEKLNKILKQGLTPHSSKIYYNFEDRIYFTLDKNSLKDFAKNKSNILKKNCFVVLEIQINGVTNRMRFFKDPNFKNGIYTLENIPPFAIIPLEKIR